MAVQPKNKADRRRRNTPIRGEWQCAPGVGWQHGEIPKPPARMLKATKEAWDIWFKAWFAAHWTPDDLPGLKMIATLYDAVQRGKLQRSSELRIQMDNYGITPKGQQDRRWKKPEPEKAQTTTEGKGSHYGHLRAVGEDS